LLIGTDGGGEAFAFDISGDDPTKFDVPSIGMPSDAGPIVTLADNEKEHLGNPVKRFQRMKHYLQRTPKE